jgi:homoserine trans-succinylase
MFIVCSESSNWLVVREFQMEENLYMCTEATMKNTKIRTICVLLIPFMKTQGDTEHFQIVRLIVHSFFIKEGQHLH